MSSSDETNNMQDDTESPQVPEPAPLTPNGLSEARPVMGGKLSVDKANDGDGRKNNKGRKPLASDSNDPRYKQGKGRRSITPEEIRLMIQAFRDIGQNMTKVSAACGLNRRTVTKAWEDGIKRYDLQPIRDILEAEQAEARALVAAKWEKEASLDARAAGMDADAHKRAREQMSQDAIKSRADEAQMVRLARGDIAQTLAAVARMLPGMNKWAKHAAEQLEAGGPKNATDALKLMEQVSRIVERTVGAADKIMAMERRLLGQAETIIGVQMPELSMDEALAHLAASDRTLQRAKNMGLIPQNLGHGVVQGYIDADSRDETTIEPDPLPPEIDDLPPMEPLGDDIILDS